VERTNCIRHLRLLRHKSHEWVGPNDNAYRLAERNDNGSSQFKKNPPQTQSAILLAFPFHLSSSPKTLPTNQPINQNPKWTIRGARWWWFAQRMRPSQCTCGARGRNWPRSPKGSPRTSISLSRRRTPTSATPQPQSEPSKTSLRSSKALFFMGKNSDRVCVFWESSALWVQFLSLSLSLSLSLFLRGLGD
jgi:hypothetical protein